MSDRSGYKLSKGRNSGLRRKGQTMPAHSGVETGELSCDTKTGNVAVASANAVSPAISLPVSPASSREKPITETQGNKCSDKSGSESNSLKPNCYVCKHRGEVPGSAHSSCKHPAFAAVSSDPLLSLLSILGSVGRSMPFSISSEACSVVGNPHGIRNGWFQHPFNFDPVWLESCTGFTPKDQP